MESAEPDHKRAACAEPQPLESHQTDSVPESGPAPKRARPSETPRGTRPLSNEELAKLVGAERIAAIKRQVEYYLSDGNLERDAFFHKKISEDAEGWLPFSVILGSRKMKALNATEDDLFYALESSDKVEIRKATKPVAADASAPPAAPTNPSAPAAAATQPLSSIVPAAVRRVGNAPLPTLDESEIRKKPEKGGDQKPRNSTGSTPQTPEEIHLLGVLLQVSNIPEEMNWVRIKEALRLLIDEPTPSGESKTASSETISDQSPSTVEGTPDEEKADSNATKKAGRQSRIRFVSTVTSAGDCFIYLRKFPNDVEFSRTITSLGVDNVTLPVKVVSDVALARKVFSQSLPPAYRRERDREWSQMRAQFMNRAITVGGTPFESIDHLRKCCRELIQKAVPGENLKPRAFTVIKGLLEYHPNKSKADKMVAIKVDVQTEKQGPNAGQSPSRCFFIVREDGSCDDFSYLKCLEAMRRNPPFADVAKESGATSATAPPKEAAAASVN